MNSDSWIMFSALILLILLGGYFAASETAFVSSNKIRLKNMADSGSAGAKRALYVCDNADKSLTTLLILNNITHIGSASLATVIATRLWGVGSVTATTVVTTIVVFLVSETIPKNYAAHFPEKFAVATAGIMKTLMVVCTPVSYIFTGISKLFSKLFTKKEEPTVNEDELYDIIETAQEEGSIEKEKGELIHSALEFDAITVKDILTPRIDVVALDCEMTPREIIEAIKESRHSRLVVYRDAIDNVVGTLSIRKYIKNYLKNGENTVLEDITDAPYFVYRTMPVDDLLRRMSASKQHMAVVSDDYGGMLGIVTIEDMLEELVGEIWDEDDIVREDFIPMGGSRYEINADLSVEDACELMEVKIPDEADAHKTLGAWALEHFDYVPQRNDSFRCGTLKVSVEEIMHSRIVKLIIQITDGEEK